MKTLNYKLVIVSMVLFTFLLSCGSSEAEFYPKPSGFLRIEFPERTYQQYESDCPYSFEIPDYFAVIDKDTFCNMKDIEMARFNATINLTYLPVDSNLFMLIERSRNFVYEHSQFADAIEEEPVVDAKRKAYGLKYYIEGDAASPFQFYLTDSVNHFMRGALYFNVKPNYDSIRPSLDYIQEDMDRLINTVIWKPSTN